MPGSKLPVHLAAILFQVCVAAGCNQLQSLARPTVLKSPDGKFQLTVPPGWREDLSLNEKAGIKAANPLQEMYVAVFSEEKADTDELTLDQYTRITLDSMTSILVSPDSSPPLPVTISGNAGRQYVIQGAAKNVKYSYLVTTVETAAHFHQIVTSTPLSRTSKNQTTMQKVAETFRSTSQGGTGGFASVK